MLEAVTVELEQDPELKVLSALEARRVRKDSTDVLMGRGPRQYRDTINKLLEEMRAEGQLGLDINLDAVSAPIVSSMAEAQRRDQGARGPF